LCFRWTHRNRRCAAQMFEPSKTIPSLKLRQRKRSSSFDTVLYWAVPGDIRA
jgi:hypothetical protein